MHTDITDLTSQLSVLKLPIIEDDVFNKAVKDLFLGKRIADWPYGHTENPYDRRCIWNAIRTVMDKLVIRHTKDQPFNNRDKLIKLPERHMNTIKVSFSYKEKSAYERLYNFAKAQYDKFARAHQVVSKIIQIVSLLMPLRQACSGGNVNVREAEEGLRELERQIREQEQLQAARIKAIKEAAAAHVSPHLEPPFNDPATHSCAFCLDAMNNPYMTICRHAFCQDW